VDVTRVIFRAFGAVDVARYMEREPALDCAGGFKCEGLGVTLMTRIESQDPTGLIGLPLIWLSGALRDAGLSSP
jgi:septum formation protein